MFAAGVDLHGVHDGNLEIPNFVPAYDPTKTRTRRGWPTIPHPLLR
jgi:hypothetical protein